jgi:hypothetical protein
LKNELSKKPAVKQALGGALPASYHDGPGSIPGRHVAFVVAKVALEQIFFPDTSVSPGGTHSTNCFTFMTYYMTFMQRLNARQFVAMVTRNLMMKRVTFIFLTSTKVYRGAR